MFALLAGLCTSIASYFTASLAFLSAFLLSLFGSWTTVLYALLIAFIGYEVYNFICTTVQEVLAFVSSQYQNISPPGSPGGSGASLVPLAAYLAYHFQLPQCFSFIIGCITLKWAIVKVPFIKW